MDAEFRDRWAQRLRDLEPKLGFADGFHLLYSPWATLSIHRVIFLSLNPSEAPDGADLRKLSDERGNSYHVERETTKSPITAQFLKLCNFLQVAPSEVLTGAFVPFRSDNWKKLPAAQRKAGLEVAEKFWRPVLEQSQARLLVACCPEAARFGARIWKLSGPESYATGWGNYSADLWENHERHVIRLPHLSTFKLFSRPESQPYLADLFRHVDIG